MTDAKAKWQQDIETATGPTGATAQLLDNRVIDLEMKVLAMEQRLNNLENVSVNVAIDSTENFNSIQSRIGVLKFDDLCKRENSSK